MKKYLALLAAVVLLASSCVKQEDVTFTGIKNFDLRSTSALNLAVGIENRSGHKLHLVSATFDVEMKGEKFMGVVLAQPVEVPRHFLGEVPVALRMSMTDPLAGLSAFNRIAGGSDQITVSGQIVVKAGWTRKKITLSHEPIGRLMSRFGIKL